jgi:hypothetical protein
MGKLRHSNIVRSSTSTGPRETQRILLKSKKFVNASFGHWGKPIVSLQETRMMEKELQEAACTQKKL